jgi:hypothetical protein
MTLLTFLIDVVIIYSRKSNLKRYGFILRSHFPGGNYPVTRDMFCHQDQQEMGADALFSFFLFVSHLVWDPRPLDSIGTLNTGLQSSRQSLTHISRSVFFSVILSPIKWTMEINHYVTMQYRFYHNLTT